MSDARKKYCQLFARQEDQQFEDVDKLLMHCYDKQRESEVHWRLPAEMIPVAYGDRLKLKLSGNSAYDLNDWSFGQICELANVKKDTLNRLKPETAASVLMETFPFGSRPYQVFTLDGVVHSIHRVGFTRIFDAEILDLVIDEAFDFDAPPKGIDGSTGMYAGEQDMFAFFIDNKMWVEIGDEQFAPGFYIWNSEVGRRSLGIETFWFQRDCANHIVWDAKERVTYRRKHTANVQNSLDDIRSILKRLVQSRDARKDAFATAMSNAQKTVLGSNSEDVTNALTRFGIAMAMIKESVELMSSQPGGFTLFNAVDCLTRLAGKIFKAGDRIEVDAKIGQLMNLAV